MKLIVACDPNGGIGYKNKLPWQNIEGDLPRFKKLTENKIVVMGRNTWESLPVKPLPKRTNIVISNSLKDDRALILPNVGKLKDANDVWLIGGAKLIDSVFESISEIHLTRVLTEHSCDTFIDLVKLEKYFTLISTEKYKDHNYEIWVKSETI